MQNVFYGVRYALVIPVFVELAFGVSGVWLRVFLFFVVRRTDVCLPAMQHGMGLDRVSIYYTSWYPEVEEAIRAGKEHFSERLTAEQSKVMSSLLVRGLAASHYVRVTRLVGAGGTFSSALGGILVYDHLIRNALTLCYSGCSFRWSESSHFDREYRLAVSRAVRILVET